MKIGEYCEKNDLILDKERSIVRTGIYNPTLKGIDYDYLNELLDQEKTNEHSE